MKPSSIETMLRKRAIAVMLMKAGGIQGFEEAVPFEVLRDCGEGVRGEHHSAGLLLAPSALLWAFVDRHCPGLSLPASNSAEKVHFSVSFPRYCIIVDSWAAHLSRMSQ